MKGHNVYLAISLIFIAVLSRLIPHYPNFTALGAAALFSGALLRSNPLLAFGVPIASYWLSDLILNNLIYSAYYDGFVLFSPSAIYQYLAIAAMVALGRGLGQPKSTRLLGASIAAATVFYLISNFGVWLSSGMYPHTLSGLLLCYEAGLPFFLKGTLPSTILYSYALFTVYAYLRRRVFAHSG